MDCKGGEGSCQRFINLRRIEQPASLSILSSGYVLKTLGFQMRWIQFISLNSCYKILVSKVWGKFRALLCVNMQIDKVIQSSVWQR
jgi:hypothetical protein